MSRIGKLPITVPQGVTVTIAGTTVTVKGPKGELKQEVHRRMKVTLEGTALTIERLSDEIIDRSLHGLTRSLLQNMILGVTVGFQKQLEINGVGYKAQAQGKKLTMSLGYSHPIIVEATEGVSFEVKDNLITISGIDKQLVGEQAAKIRKHRPPEPYKGKGIRYVDEHVKRKEGKRVAAAS